jgi:hypothetical protein
MAFAVFKNDVLMGVCSMPEIGYDLIRRCDGLDDTKPFDTNAWKLTPVDPDDPLVQGLVLNAELRPEPSKA